jgi:hypothetical protein
MAHLCGLDEYLDDLTAAPVRFDVYQKSEGTDQRLPPFDAKLTRIKTYRLF